jgi:hypothetical protein
MAATQPISKQVGGWIRARIGHWIGQALGCPLDAIAVGIGHDKVPQPAILVVNWADPGVNALGTRARAAATNNAAHTRQRNPTSNAAAVPAAGVASA